MAIRTIPDKNRLNALIRYGRVSVFDCHQSSSREIFCPRGRQMSHLHGYARVSRADGRASRQREQLKAAGCEFVYVNTNFAKPRHGRDPFAAMIEKTARGDSIVVSNLHRLAFTFSEVMSTLQLLAARGIGVRVLHPAFDTLAPPDAPTFIALIAETEAFFAKEALQIGTRRLPMRGSRKGRPVMLDHARLLRMHREGYGATEIAREIGCSRTAVYNVLKGAASKSAPVPAATVAVSGSL